MTDNVPMVDAEFIYPGARPGDEFEVRDTSGLSPRRGFWSKLRSGGGSEPWDAWASRRGLAPATPDQRVALDLPGLAAPLSAQQARCYAGLLLADRPAWLGRARWDTPDAAEDDRWASFVAMEFDFAHECLPASAVIAAGVTERRIPTAWLSERSFARIPSDVAHEILAEGSPAIWRELFDEELMSSMLTDRAVQWIQQGRWLVLLDPSGDDASADAVGIDTIASVAPRIWANYASASLAEGMRAIRAEMASESGMPEVSPGA